MDAYTVPQITRNDKTAPSYVANMLAHAGYHFFYNTETGDYVLKHNGGPYRAMDGDDEHNLKVWAIRNGIKPSDVKYAIAELADLNRISLIKDSLESLTWDGQQRIADLAACLQVTRKWPRDLALRWLTSWMLGAVGKVLGDAQNPVLVIEGDSGIGKSYLAYWLGSAIESAFISSDLKLNNRKSIYNAQRYFVWEILNLDQIRGADVISFRNFITLNRGSVRSNANQRKLNASFIATTRIRKHECMTTQMGSRRFLILPVMHIDWIYTALNSRQLWAEAVYRWRAGERGTLQGDDIKLRDDLFDDHNPHMPYIISK